MVKTKWPCAKCSVNPERGLAVFPGRHDSSGLSGSHLHLPYALQSTGVTASSIVDGHIAKLHQESLNSCGDYGGKADFYLKEWTL